MAMNTFPHPKLPSRCRKYVVAGLLVVNAAIHLAHAALGATSDAPRQLVRLETRNGNSLQGNLLLSSGDFLQIYCPDFTDPIQFSLKEIHKIAFPNRTVTQQVLNPKGAPFPSIEEPFLFLTTSDAIRANIRSVTEDEFLVHSERHGEFSIQRSEVRRIRHLGKQTTLKVGSLRLTDLRSLRQGRPVQDWTEVAGQGLITNTFGAEMFRDFDFPESAEIRIILESSKNLQFCLAIASVKSGRLSKNALKVETWNDELVAQCETKHGINFHSLGTMSDTRQLELRLRWDQWSREFTVHSANDELLGKLESIEPVRRTGIYLQNRGADIKVVELSVSRVEEKSGAPLRKGTMHWQSTDGTQVSGVLMAFDLASQTFEVRTNSGEAKKIPFESVYSITVDNEPPRKNLAKGAFLLTFTDTTRLHGDLMASDGDFLHLQTSLSTLPWKVPIKDIVEIECLQPPVGPSIAPYQLTIGNQIYTGTLAPLDASGRIGWRSDGANNVTTPRSGSNAYAERSDYHLPPPQEVTQKGIEYVGSDVSTHSDIVYLKTGESIPCSVQSITGKALHVDSTTSNQRSISTELIRGVEFNRAPFRAFPPFTDWDVQETATRLERQPNKLNFYSAANRLRQDGVNPFANISSSSVTRGDQWQFDLEFEHPSYVQIEIRRSVEKADAQPSDCVYLAFSYNGSMIQSYMHYQGAAVIRNLRQATAIIRNHKRTKVQVDFSPDGVQMTMGKEKPLQIETSRIEGEKFLVRIHFFNMVNSQDHGDNAMDSPKELRMCSLSNLRIFSRPLHSRLALTSEESDTLLTIPRSYKPGAFESLLVARNRDILRGNLVAIDETTAYFSVRGQVLEVPRIRLIGVLWLEPPEFDPQKTSDTQNSPIEPSPSESPESDPVPTPANPPVASNSSKGTEDKVATEDIVDVVLESGIRLQVTSARLTSHGIEGQHAWTGKVSLPLASLKQVRFEPSTNPLEFAGLPVLTQKFAPEPKHSADASAASGSALIGRRSPLIGRPLGNFRCPTTKGMDFRSVDHQGKILVIDFWATWCGPCVRELPRTIQTVAQFPADKVQHVALNQGENSRTVNSFVETHNWNATIGIDPENHWSKEFKLTAIPQTMIVGPQGNIVRVYAGSHRDLQREISATIAELLKE